MSALVIFLIVALVVLAIELVMYWLAPINRVIDAVGDFWAHVAYIAALFVIAYDGSMLDIFGGIVGIAAGILAAIVIHSYITRPVPLTFFSHLPIRGEDTQ
jgi:hypothetical protein